MDNVILGLIVSGGKMGFLIKVFFYSEQYKYLLEFHCCCTAPQNKAAWLHCQVHQVFSLADNQPERTFEKQSCYQLISPTRWLVSH